jgi:hypothetical protein
VADTDSGAERRKFPRLRENCRIRVRPLAGAQLPGSAGTEAVTVNISGGGLAYRSTERVETGEFLAVELTMPDFTSPVVALARVAWVSSPTPPAEVGVEFWWVGWGDDSAQRAISDYIKSELRQREPRHA